MNPDPSVGRVSRVFRVLGDETRCTIVYMLATAERCTCELAQALGITMPAVSHHLRILKQARLVDTRQEGKHVYYRLADEHVEALLAIAREHELELTE
jgi:DNA-binding transcriptional ArsR family regulator